MKFNIYKDKRGEFRWRLVTANGQIIAASGEGYKRKADCLSGIRTVIEAGPGAPIVMDKD